MSTLHPERSRATHGLLALTLTLGCSEAVAPLKLKTVSPVRAAEGAVIDLELSGEGILAAVITDFQKTGASQLDATVTAALVAADGTEVPLEEVVFIDTAKVHARVPANIARGLYDVRITDARRASDTLPGAFSIIAAADAVARFEFQPVGNQHARVPFAVRALAVDAAGALVESFDGMLELSDDSGTVRPATVGPFVRGRLQVFVSIDVLTPATILHLRNTAGKTGDSETFSVTPGPATSVVFAQSPTAANAGGCAGPFELRLHDTWGFPTPATADLSVSLSAIPGLGVEFFSDGSCSLVASSLVMGTGVTAKQLYVKATVAGALAVRAAPEALPSVQTQLQVMAQAPTRLNFATAPSTVGVNSCSAVFEVRSEDSLGNTSAPATAKTLTLSALPAAGVAFFDDDACTTPVNAPTLGATKSQVRFFLKSTIEALVHVDVAATALTSAGADVAVTP